MELGVVFEAIPEDGLCLFAAKRGETISASRSDEIDGVVAVPVLESAMLIDVLPLG